jgi:hypothetical protein
MIRHDRLSGQHRVALVVAGSDLGTLASVAIWASHIVTLQSNAEVHQRTGGLRPESCRCSTPRNGLK